jgi:hypothetical protein
MNRLTSYDMVGEHAPIHKPQETRQQVDPRGLKLQHFSVRNLGTFAALESICPSPIRLKDHDEKSSLPIGFAAGSRCRMQLGS